MMRFALTLLMVLAANGVHAQASGGNAPNSTADSNASCNASFHVGCMTDSGGSVASSGFAAPVGALGASLPESASLAVLVVIAAACCRRRVKRSAPDEQERCDDDARGDRR
jgi:hypothetical protein